MLRNAILSFALLLAGVATLSAEESVSVAGTNYPVALQQTVGSQTVTMSLTGTAVRKKLIVNVYTIGSYVDARVNVQSAKQLAGVDAVKQIHLVMKRELTGAQLADAFAEAIRMNYAAPKFEAEIKSLSAQLRAIPSVPKEHQIRLSHIPGVGFYAGSTHQTHPSLQQAVATAQERSSPNQLSDVLS